MDKQERIDRAVIGLGGEWPADKLTPGMIFYDGHPVSRPEFMEARKRIFEEKKMDKIDWSKAPEGATHAGLTSAGTMWYKVSKTGFSFFHGAAAKWLEGVGEPFYKPLEPRPHPDHKEGEGVYWEPGVDLPPVGVECLWMEDNGIWLDAKCIGYDGPAAVMAVDGVGYRGATSVTMVRAKKSHREKVIEAAVKNHNIKRSYRESMEHLYDLGMLKLPGDDQ